MPLPPDQWRALCVPPVIEALEKYRLATEADLEAMRTYNTSPSQSTSLAMASASQALTFARVELDAALRDV